MACITTKIIIAIMTIVFSCLHVPLLISKKQCCFLERNKQKIHILQNKIGCQKFQVLVNASKFFSINIHKFRNQNLLKANDENSSHLFFIFYMSWVLLYLTKKVCCLYFLNVFLQRSKSCINIPSWDNFDKIKSWSLL